MCIRDDARELAVDRTFDLVKVLVMRLVFEVCNSNHPVGVHPGIAVIAHPGHIDVGAPVDQLRELAGVDVVGPEAELVIAMVGQDENMILLRVIDLEYLEGVELVVVLAAEFFPAGLLAGAPPVPDGLVIGVIGAAGEPRVAVAVELDLTERDLAANQEFLGAPLQVELPVGARPERFRQLSAGIVVIHAAFLEGDDDLVRIIREQVLDQRIGLVELLHLLLFDIDDRKPGLVDAPVEALDPVADLLPQVEDDVVVARPEEISDLHGVRVQREYRLALVELGRFVHLDDRVRVFRRYLHDAEVLAVRRHLGGIDDRAQRPVIERVRLVVQ